MAAGYDKTTLTLAAATAQRLSDLLAAEGYTNSMCGAFLELEDVNSLGDVYHGSSSTLDATNGRSLTIYTRRKEGDSVVDPSRIFLYSVGGGDIAATFEPI